MKNQEILQLQSQHARAETVAQETSNQLSSLQHNNDILATQLDHASQCVHLLYHSIDSILPSSMKPSSTSMILVY